MEGKTYHTVTFKDATDYGKTGELLAKQYVEHGTMPILPNEPAAPSGYRFAGWSPEVVPAAGDQNYVATYQKIDKITVTIHYWAGSTENHVEIAKDAVLTYYAGETKTDTIPSPATYNLYPDPAFIVIDPTQLTSDMEYTVWYKAANTHYTIQYYFENLVTNGNSFDAANYTLDAQYTSGSVAANAGSVVFGTPYPEVIPGFTYHHADNVVVKEGDKTIAPVYYTRNTNFIVFDTLGGDAVDSISAKYGKEVVLPTADTVTHEGYTFGGWYPGYDAQTLQCTGNPVDTSYTMPAEETTILYAKWIPAEVNYKLVLWVEKAGYSSPAIGRRTTGNPGKTPNDLKYYDFLKEVSAKGLTDSKPELPANLQKTITAGEIDGSEQEAYKNVIVADLKGYDTDVTIAGDGTTVVNVYYHLRQFYWQFSEKYTSGDWYFDYKGTTYHIGDKNLVLSVKYMQNVVDYWPNRQLITNLRNSPNGADKTSTFSSWTPHASDNSGDSMRSQVDYATGRFLSWEADGSSKSGGHDPDAQTTIFYLNAGSSGSIKIKYMVEAIDGENVNNYKPTYTGTVYNGSENPHTTAKGYDAIENITFWEHSLSQDVPGASYLGAKGIKGFDVCVSGQNTDNTLNQIENMNGSSSTNGVYHFYYTRTKPTLTFDEQGGSPVAGNIDGATVPYEKKLLMYKPTNYTENITEKTVNGVQYKFVGWYYDQAGSKAMDWSSATMPTTDLQLFAKWEPIKVDVTVHVAIYEDQQSDEGWSNTYPAGSRLTDDPEFKLVPKDDKGVWTFAGWFTEPNGEGKAFNPADRLLDEHTTIYAHWVRAQVAYTVYYVSIDENGQEVEVAPSKHVNEQNVGDTVILDPLTPDDVPSVGRMHFEKIEPSSLQLKPDVNANVIKVYYVPGQWPIYYHVLHVLANDEDTVLFDEGVQMTETNERMVFNAKPIYKDGVYYRAVAGEEVVSAKLEFRDKDNPNIIYIHYEPYTAIPYEVHYFYDDVKDETATHTGSVLLGNSIAENWHQLIDDHRNEIRYTYDKTEVTDESSTHKTFHQKDYQITPDAEAGKVTINIHYTSKLVDVTVTKIWDDNNNHDGTRPGNLNVTLSANESIQNISGELTGDYATDTKVNEWGPFTFTGLPMYGADDTEKIVYTVTEDVPKEYEQTNETHNGNNWTFTNRYDSYDASIGKTATRKDSDAAYKLGEVVPYTLVVKNTGNMLLKNVTVQDIELSPIVNTTTAEGVSYDPSNQTWTIASLDVGKEVSLTYTYKVQEKDLGADDIVQMPNTAKVTFKDGPQENPDTPTVSHEASAYVPVEERNPQITIEKSTSADANYRPGDDIPFLITIENTGNVTLTNVYIEDSLAGDPNFSELTIQPLPKLNGTGKEAPITLAPGELRYYTVFYHVTEADYFDENGALKSENGLKITNVATVQATYKGQVLEKSDTAEATFDPLKTGLAVYKTHPNRGKTDYKLGEKIPFIIDVTNTGEVTLHNITVTDENAVIQVDSRQRYSVENGVATIEKLEPAKTVHIYAEHTVTQEDIDAGIVENTAIASTPDIPDPENSDKPEEFEDDDEVLIRRNPDLEIEKHAVNPTGKYGLGDKIQFQVTVKNTGDVTLQNVVVRDTRLKVEKNGFAWNVSVNWNDPKNTGVFDETNHKTYGPGHWTVDTANNAVTIKGIGVGGVYILTYVCEVTQADVDAGHFYNVAIAKGTPVNPKDDDPKDPEKQDDEDVPLPRDPGLKVTKTADRQSVSAVGDVINYTITVENTGNVTLHNIDVRDELEAPAQNVSFDKVAAGINSQNVGIDGNTATIGELAPGGKVTLTASYTVTQDDLDAGNVGNVATATAPDPTDPDPNDPDKPPVEDKDEEDVPVEQNPKLDLEKRVTKLPEHIETGYVLDETIQYEITVTNKGNVTLHDVNIEDGLADATIDSVVIEGIGSYEPNADGSITVDEMKPGDIVTLTVTYTVKQEDIDAKRVGTNDKMGYVSNFATAEGKDPNEDPVRDTDTATVEIPRDPKVEAVKTLTNAGSGADGAFRPGEKATFDITVTNSGNTTQETVRVGEQLIDATIVAGEGYEVEDGVAVITDMAPGDEVVVKAEYVVKQSDVDAFEKDDTILKNVATVDPDEGPDPDPDPEKEIPLDPTGALSVTKVATSGSGPYLLGQTVNYRITVRNVGSVTVENITVRDNLTGARWSIDKLERNESRSFTTSHVVTLADVRAGSVYNVATASGTTPGGEPVEDRDSETVEVKKTHLTLTKITTSTPANGTAYALGETITYGVTVTNDGGVTVTNVTVTDELTGDVWTVASMEPGDSETFTASHVVTEADILAGHVRNVVTGRATGPDPDDPDVPVEPDETDDPTDPKHGHLSVEKITTSTPAGENGYTWGETITYSVTATNDGNLTLTNVVVTDELTGNIWEVGTMAPGAQVSFTTSHVVTDADVLAGHVLNVATATGTSPDPDEPDVPVDPGETDDPTEPKHGHLTVEKVTTSAPANGTAYVLGETIRYSVTATNDGNLKLTDVVVTDELTGDRWEVGTMEPGDSVSFTTSHVVTEADILAGHVLNVATATGTSPDPDEPDVPVDPGETDDPTEPKHSELTVEKRAPAGPYGVGDTITYTIVVTNSGNMTLTDVHVTDPLTGLNQTIPSLAPGQSQTFTTTYVVTQADVNEGSVYNVATASGTDPEDIPVTDEDDETVEALPRVTLTVRYWYNAVGGRVAAPTFRRTYFVGDRYNVASPSIAGYRRSLDRARGTITRDTVIDVIYTANIYTLTVNYVYEDGTTAAPTYTERLNAGNTYSVTSPTIPGYTPSRTLVAGTMPARNVTYTVIYVPDTTEILIDEYGIPLNIGNVTMNVGDCFE